MSPSAFFRRGAAVPSSGDLDRVLALPRRPPLDLGSPRARALVEIMTDRLRRPDRAHDGGDCGCAALGRRCVSELLPAQAWALWEAGVCGGLLGALAVGSGKTLVGVLAPLVLRDCRHAALLVPSGLVGQVVSEYLAYREHFRVPSLVSGLDSWLSEAGAPVLRVVPYSRLSRPESTALLDELELDLVVADEAHHLRGREAARTRRLLRLFLRRPDTRLLAWSGTVTGRSLRDFAHLAALSLCEGSPLPLDPDEVERWAAAVDPSDWPAPPGELRRLVATTGAAGARDAVRVRLSETRGYVSTTSATSCSASLVFRERRPPAAPSAVSEALASVRRTWTRPDGEELVEAVEVARVVREVASGFYYRWLFPGDPAPEVLDEWFAARRDWRRELREKLSDARPYLDSPHLCAAAAERARRGEPPSETAPVWRSATWARWAAVKDRVEHETEAVWLDPWLARDAAAWTRETAGVVWYVHDAFGRAVAEAAGLRAHFGGDDAELRAEIAAGRPLVLSLRAYGTGFDGLQRAYRRALVTNLPSSGDAWEQLVGRLHRQGQEADEVVFEVYRHEPEVAGALDKALAQAKYVEGVTGSRQRLLSADVEWSVCDLGAGDVRA